MKTEAGERQGESKLVQAENFHRGGAETMQVGEDARQRAGEIGAAGRGESSLVQPFFLALLIISFRRSGGNPAK